MESKKEWLTPQEVENEFSIKKATQAKMRMAKNQDKTNPFIYSLVGKVILYRRCDIENFILNKAKNKTPIANQW